MKEKFIQKRFNEKSIEQIYVLNRILSEYEAKGYKLTLRQLYYQLVARDLIPNTVRSYKNIGNLVSNARLAGLIDWNMIEDRNRTTFKYYAWESMQERLEATAAGFRIDHWQGQNYHIEVMVEKDALSGILNPIGARYDVGITANKGYSSSSAMYDIGKRIEQKAYEGKRPVILYLGDHDPSGLDMIRDIEERLIMFSGVNYMIIEVLALTMEQVRQWNPPTNPAKQTDSRFEDYAAKYGQHSWELDAVEPEVLERLVSEAIINYRDEDTYTEVIAKQREMRDYISTLAELAGTKDMEINKKYGY